MKRFNSDNKKVRAYVTDVDLSLIFQRNKHKTLFSLKDKQDLCHRGTCFFIIFASRQYPVIPTFIGVSKSGKEAEFRNGFCLFSSKEKAARISPAALNRSI